MSTLFIQLAGMLVAAHHQEKSPAVVVAEKCVYDVNSVAQKLGVRVGMLVREAKTLIPHLVTHEFNEKQCEPFRTEWLDITTLYTDQVESHAPHQAFLALDKHPRPDEVAQLLLDHLERRFAFGYEAGLSPTKWVAQALAGCPLRQAPLPGFALANESTNILLPIAAEVRQRLIFLGYKRVRDVQALKISTLKSQFGTEAHRILAIANGSGHEAVIGNYPANRATNSFSFEGGSSDLQEIQLVLGEMSRSLFAELSRRGFSAKDIHLMVGLEDSTLETQATFAKPFRGAHGLQLALARLLEGMKLEAPIYRLTITLPNLARVKPKQRTLAGVPVGDASFTEDALESVRHKFGGYSVHLGKEHREPRRVHVLRAWSKATGWQ